MGACQCGCGRPAGIEVFDGDEPFMVCVECADEYWPLREGTRASWFTPNADAPQPADS